MKNLKSKIESILFLAGEPMALARLAKIVKEKPNAVEAALKELEREYNERGIRILRHDGEWQLGTAPENAPVLEDLVKSEFTEELSRAALETISVIAYKGPMTRAEIEHIRGVNSSFSLRNLLLRGLVERIENPKDARSYLYNVSMDFLKYLGLANREALPEWRTLKEAKTPQIDEVANKDAAG
ncbi:MAG: SMC-Scp complex subunit ScpB [Candidatus Sungbacteria bacterium]|nr:SMC-Scp complex subunit ScpB [Candidatus Sungbacteria bacterium]